MYEQQRSGTLKFLRWLAVSFCRRLSSELKRGYTALQAGRGAWRADPSRPENSEIVGTERIELSTSRFRTVRATDAPRPDLDNYTLAIIVLLVQRPHS